MTKGKKKYSCELHPQSINIIQNYKNIKIFDYKYAHSQGEFIENAIQYCLDEKAFKIEEQNNE